MIDYTLERCIREIRNSTNLDMLRVAKRYADLYSHKVSDEDWGRIQVAYKRKKKDLI
jgi:hypothetical protein